MSTPLDPARAASYGLFVAAAYAMYCAAPTECYPAPQGLPDGWTLWAWITMSDFLDGTTAPKFYGIVAQQAADPANFVVAIRGTEGITEWIDDGLSFHKVPFSLVPNAGSVAYGFERIYQTIQLKENSEDAEKSAPGSQLTGSFAEQLHQLVLRDAARRGVAPPIADTSSTVVTGHSLGSALVTLLVVENTVSQHFNITLLSTLASPLVGDATFANFFNALQIDSWRIVNTPDIVPKLPPTWLGFVHVNQPYSFDSRQFAKASLSCYHHLPTYMHWLNANIPLTQSCQFT